jgi:translation initiation factor IF-3
MTIAVSKSKAPEGGLINEKIRFDKMQLITHEGKNVGVVTREIALRAARDVGLDLVIIAEQGKDGLPIAKIMDYGKVLYAKKKQLSDAKKKQHLIQVKELKLRPKIGEHDLKTKLHQALELLTEGKRVKFTLIFKGREVAMKQERGTFLFNKIHKALEESPVGAQLLQEKDMLTDSMWSRVYYLKK